MDIRIVRGATAWDVVWLVLRKGLLLTPWQVIAFWNEALMRRLSSWTCGNVPHRRVGETQ
jgi:hypothetical protein